MGRGEHRRGRAPRAERGWELPGAVPSRATAAALGKGARGRRRVPPRGVSVPPEVGRHGEGRLLLSVSLRGGRASW